ncbi:MAG: hypothetical protein HQ559_09835, partial [Lentisphaerae bacterium]|nr:hypothetical protein [Lentisphaerota bacterium]
MKISRRVSLRLFAVLVAMSFPLPVSGELTNFVWDSTTPKSGNWSVDENWTNGAAPSSGGDTTYILEFGGSGSTTYSAANDLGNGFLLNRLRFTSSSSANSAISGQSLMFNNGGIEQNGAGVFSIANTMAWTEPLALSGSGSGGVIFSNTVLTLNAAGRRVEITGGGTWESAGATVGQYVPNTLLSVSGATDPAVLDLRAGNLVVGYGNVVAAVATGNQVRIANGGIATNIGAVAVGGIAWGATTVGNSLVITNGGSLFSTAASSVGAAGAGSNANNTVWITGGAGVTSVWDLGSTALSLGHGYGNGNVITVDGRGAYGSAAIRNAAGLSIGTYNLYSVQGGVDCALIVTNGGVVSSPGSANGYIGHSNRMEIVDGSRFEHYGSWSMSGRGSLMVVRGTNSIMERLGVVAGTLTVGNTKPDNVLRVEDGGVVTGLNLIVGSGAGANGNTFSLVGGGKLYGDPAGGYPTIGNSASMNTALVSGADTLWDMAARRFYVGVSGARNECWITAHAVVTNMGN